MRSTHTYSRKIIQQQDLEAKSVALISAYMDKSGLLLAGSSSWAVASHDLGILTLEFWSDATQRKARSGIPGPTTWALAMQVYNLRPRSHNLRLGYVFFKRTLHAMVDKCVPAS